MKNTNSIRQVFISYTDQGKVDALRLREMIADKIKKTHAIVWEWRDQIPGGAAIIEKYTKALQVSDLFIPVITPNYKGRPGTQDEIIKAGERQSYLRALYGDDYNFIIPFIGKNQEPDLLKAT